MKKFKLSIYASDKIVYEGECESLVIPTTTGQLGILANHSNLISLTIPGKLTFKNDGKEDVRIVSQGMVKIEDNEVLVLVEACEKPEEIDINRALKAEEKAKAELKKHMSNREYNMVYARLARAFSRAHIKDGFKR